MATTSTTSSVSERSAGRGYFWMGLVICLLALGLVVAQYSLGQFIVPWYLPILTTLGAFLILLSMLRRASLVRIAAFGVILLVAGFQWYFLVSLSRLPAYEGPARAGRALPAFQTTLADGRPFTEKDLQDGKRSIMVFFRGRW
jgi:hypothetical protein